MKKKIFLLSVFVSRLGDSFSFLAFFLLFLKSGFSTLFISLFLVARYLPSVLIGMMPRQKPIFQPHQVLISSYLVSACSVFLAMYQQSEWVLLLLSLTLGVCYGIYVPLQKSMIPEIFEKEDLLKANTAVQGSEIWAKSVGFALAGIVFHQFSAKISFLFDGISFLVIAFSMGIIFRKHADIHEDISQKTQEGTVDRKSNNLIQEKIFKKMILIFACGWVSTGAFFALEGDYAQHYLKASDFQLGLLFAFATVGSYFGQVIIRRNPSLSDPSKLKWFVFFEIAGVLFYALTGNIIMALVGIVIYGGCLSLRNILVSSWIHKNISRDVQSVAFRQQNGLANFAMMTAMASAGPIALSMSSRATMILFCVFALTGLFYGLLQRNQKSATLHLFQISE